MDIFEEVKNRVSLLQYVESETSLKAKKEGSTLRVSPCPLCGHNECFTLYPDTNSFHCFSCDQAGDAICFERLNKGLGSNLEAAKSIAEKMGISLDGAGGARQPGRKPSEQKESEPEAAPDIDPAQARALRRIAAEFYHGELLGNKKALEYQTEKRGHSLEVLKKFKVGYAGRKSLIAHIKKVKEYSVQDLVNVGLVKEMRKGFVPVIPQGHYIYPHCVKGEVLFFSIKDPTGKLKFQIKKKFADKDWLCLNQESLMGTGPVILVEGENDFLSLVDKAKMPNVSCIIGNFNTSNLLAYLKENSKEKTFYLCFDRDDAGRKYVKQYTSAIHAGGGLVRVMEVPEPHNDVDDFLKASSDPEGDFKKLIEAAKIIEKPKGKKSNSNKTKAINAKGASRKDQGGGAGSDRYHFDTFEVLGELEDDRIVIESKDIHKIYIVHINRDLTLEKFVQFGGQEARERVVRNMEQAKEDGKVHLYDLRKQVIVEARDKQRGPLRWLGQGVHLLEDDRLLIVNGDLAYIWDGRSFEPYEVAMIENKLIARNVSRRWISFESLEKAVLNMTSESGRKVVVKLIHLIQQWGFQGAYDYALVTGFVLSQMVQSVWKWRPHAWLTGPQGSGKTLFVNLCEEIAGKLSRRFEGSSTTEAGFRQSMKHDFCLACIDEFEKSPARDQIMSYLRTAGRGGPIVKGTPGQDAIEYMLKHMVLVASIETGLVRAAEKTRFLTVELKKDPKRDPHIPTVEEMEQLRIEFFAVALWSAFRAKALVSQFGRIQGYDPRLVEAFAVPLSMLSVVDPEPAESLKKYVVGVLEDRKEHGDDDIPEDEVRLLDDILTSKIRVAVSDDLGHTVYAERPVQWLLQSSSALHKTDLEAHGVKKCGDGIFFACDVISRELLRNTIWKEMQIVSILKRLPGAESKQRRINKRRFHGILCQEIPGLINSQKADEKARDGSGDLFSDD